MGYRIADLPAAVRHLILPLDTGCWRWVGKVDRNGYGRTGQGWAHRTVYEYLVRPIGDGLHLDHLCRVPLCVNPSHLEEVTPRENFLRSNHPRAIAYRTDTCKNGHSLTEHGSRMKSGHRYCKACRREYQRAAYIRQEWPTMIARKHAKGSYRRRTPEEVADIRERLAGGMSQRAVAKVYDCSPSTISEIARGVTHPPKDVA